MRPIVILALSVCACGATPEAVRESKVKTEYVGTRLVPDEEPQIIGSCVIVESKRLSCGFLTSARCRKVWVDRAGNTHPMSPAEFSKCPATPVSGKEIGIRLEGSKVDIPVGATDAEGKITLDLLKSLPAPNDTDTKPATRAWTRVLDQNENSCEIPLDDYLEWYLAEQARLRTAKENHQIADLLTRTDSFECLKWLRNHAHVATKIDTYLRGKELARCAADELIKQAQASLRSGATDETQAYIKELQNLLPEHPKLTQIVSSLKRFKADAEYKKALAALDVDDYRLARNSVIECLALIENHHDCSKLASRINSSQIRTSWKRGLDLLKAGKYREALGVATDCLNIRQNHTRCRKLEAMAEVLLENPQPGGQSAIDSLKSQLWVELYRKAGTGITQTQPFEITADKWRVEHSNNGGGILQISVHRRHELVATVAKTNRAGKGEKTLQEKGTHFIKINSANTRWVVSVKQYLSLEAAASLRVSQKKAKLQTFKTVAEFSGRGSQTTKEFSIDADRWKIEYSSSGKGFLQIMVFQGTRHASTAANMTTAGKGESWIYEPGTFLLKINSAKTKWKVKVLSPP